MEKLRCIGAIEHFDGKEYAFTYKHDIVFEAHSEIQNNVDGCAALVRIYNDAIVVCSKFDNGRADVREPFVFVFKGKPEYIDKNILEKREI
jgi:hypothetical protein